MALRRSRIPIRLRRTPLVAAVVAELPRLVVVRQVHIEIGHDTRLQAGLDYREHDLDAPEEIPFHPIGAGAEQLFVAAVVKVVDAAVLEKRPTIERTRMLSETPGMPGAEQHIPRTIRSTVDARVRGCVERAYHLGFDQRIELGDDVTRSAVARIARLATNVTQQPFVQIEWRLR